MSKNRPKKGNGVELHAAYWFTCEYCGKDTFIRSGHQDVPDLAAMNEEMGTNCDRITIDRAVPKVVFCQHCDLGNDVI